MIRGVAPLALGIAIGVMFRDSILRQIAGPREGRGPSGPHPADREGRGGAGHEGAAPSAGEARHDGAGRPFSTIRSMPVGSAGPAALSFKSLADCFDDMLDDHEAIRVAILEYANDHRGDPAVPKLLGWWTQLGDQLSLLVREAVLNDPEVLASIELIRRNSEDLTQVSEEFQQATATIEGINRGLSLVGALASLFRT